MSSIVGLPDDSLLVSDTRNQRITILHAGDYARDVRLPSPSVDAIYEPVARTADGQFVLTPRGFVLRSQEDGGWKSYPILRTRDFAGLDTVVSLPMFQFPSDGGLNPVRHFGYVVPSGNAVAYATSDRAQITWFSLDGGVTQIARWDAVSAPVTPEDWSRYELGLRGRAGSRAESPDFEPQLEELHTHFGGTKPLFRQVYGDRSGNVWLAAFDFGDIRTSRFHVVSSEGVWLGDVAFPGPFRILDIADTRVLGVEFDAFDVESVVVYRIGEAEP